jgi:hypothetical protein
LFVRGITKSVKSFKQFLTEYAALRIANPEVMQWLKSHLPNKEHLYVHGSPHRFTHFRRPNHAYGGLIFFSPLDNRDGLNRPLQAEYYGHNLYMCRLNKGKTFDPLNDATAKKQYADWLTGDVWDRENKLKRGRLDYQDLHLIVPMAVKVGYSHFRVFEMAMRDYSEAVAYPHQITIVDVFPKLK